MGGNTFVVVQADEDDPAHSDGKTAARACELIGRFKGQDRPFFLAVGFVRPHVPFVAPRRYFAPYPHEKSVLPEKIDGDWDDIPRAGINYKTSKNMKMDLPRQKKAMAGYYSAVSFMDTQVGKVLRALDESGQADNTIVVFTSDHGYHLGEHDFWAKVSLHEESARVPLIIRVPGKKPAVSSSIVELLDLYPTISSLCGLPVPTRLQGKDISAILDDSRQRVRDFAFSVNGKGFLVRDERWAFIQYGEDASGGIELFDMDDDPNQYRNLANDARHRPVVDRYRAIVAQKLREVRTNDLGLTD
jgi:iduronate 2-sulfatase